MKSAKPTALVIGMNGGIGGASGRALIARGFRLRALTRRPQAPRNGVEWVAGDAMSAEDVCRAARGVEVIVHGANPPKYRNWRGLALPMLANTIRAAVENRATIVFPGTIYNYGPDAFPLLGESTPQHPLTRKGVVRVEMERMLLEASRAGARVLLVRAGDFFGPGAGGSWFSQGLVRPGRPVTRVWYPGRHDVGHSWAYLPDLADAIARLVLRRGEFAPFESFHFEGHWLPQGGTMAQAICEVAGIPAARIGSFPWWAVHGLAPFVALFREMQEMRYLWSAPLRLDNRKLVEVLGSEPHTDLRDAVEDTLASLGCLEARIAGRRCAC
ncbi:MAG TPA: NAD-dependent epimerase/dehydratase family protein [Steroidobacteraceae bacterium]|jgi:nucleoside-diphosphate-sugar epimerase|nr:NAD-dependent epimerase/dehydratase family protein [Steroidobacteraceae bacterium]